MTALHETITTAYIQGDELVLEEFRESDPDVVAFVRAAEDAETAVHRCLEMGARALRLAGATLDTQLVEHRFDEMTGELDRSIDAFAKRVDESAEKLLDEESGDLVQALKSWMEEVTSTLDATFDENSRKSAIAKLENVLAKARKEQVDAMRMLLDPENAESPLGGLAPRDREHGRAAGQGGRRGDRRAARAAGDRGRSRRRGRARHTEGPRLRVRGRGLRDRDRPPPRGRARAHGRRRRQRRERRSATRSSPSTRPQTPGRSVRYVLEAKDKRMTLKAALAELDAAMANRDAEAAVMVFASQAICPVNDSFQWFDHKAIVVLDRDTLDSHALRLACAWARWTACRESAEACDEIDVAPRHRPDRPGQANAEDRDHDPRQPHEGEEGDRRRGAPARRAVE